MEKRREIMWKRSSDDEMVELAHLEWKSMWRMLIGQTALQKIFVHFYYFRGIFQILEEV